jgi:hypothetical protein
MERPVNLLERRVAELDNRVAAETSPDKRPAMYTWLTHFPNVLGRYTDTFMDYEAGTRPVIDADVADTIVSACRLLSDVAAHEPSLVRGPLQTDRQRWTATRKPLTGQRVLGEPRPKSFIAPSATGGDKAEVKPAAVGLHTSTATSTGCSMWRAYLEPFRGTMLYPGPWQTWELLVETDELRIAEIVSATTWVEFVESFGRIRDGFLYPDWVEVERAFDAVHVALPTIAAAQGFYLRASQGLIPPAFWDVETTLWVRWRFSGARLIETVPVR